MLGFFGNFAVRLIFFRNVKLKFFEKMGKLSLLYKKSTCKMRLNASKMPQK